MAVNLQGFKAFAGIYSPGVPAKKAIGLLTVSRTDPASQNIIENPRGDALFHFRRAEFQKP